MLNNQYYTSGTVYFIFLQLLLPLTTVLLFFSGTVYPLSLSNRCLSQKSLISSLNIPFPLLESLSSLCRSIRCGSISATFATAGLHSVLHTQDIMCRYMWASHLIRSRAFVLKAATREKTTRAKLAGKEIAPMVLSDRLFSP